MATAAQITANRANAQRSTGPISVAGKDAVSANRLAHGLSSDKFVVLPNEDAAEYEALTAALRAEYSPATPTESFLVTELARAQWKLARIQALEAEILRVDGQPSSWAHLAEQFRKDCASEQALTKLNRLKPARAAPGTRRSNNSAPSERISKSSTRAKPASKSTKLRPTGIAAWPRIWRLLR
jgi:hypothetical protein